MMYHYYLSLPSSLPPSPQDDDGEDVWTEHKSSSGRIYFYNKKLDKSQWEKPTKGTVKKLVKYYYMLLYMYYFS